jgi:hypothetical protein
MVARTNQANRSLYSGRPPTRFIEVSILSTIKRIKKIVFISRTSSTTLSAQPQRCVTAIPSVAQLLRFSSAPYDLT